MRTLFKLTPSIQFAILNRFRDVIDLDILFAFQIRYRAGDFQYTVKIISFIEDEQLVKKILKHQSLWDVKRKPPPRANGPPPETFIIYDECSSPGADEYLIDADFPIEPTLKKIRPQANPVR